MNPEPPQISLAIVTWNTREKLLACLGSLRAEGERLRLEVIVVDNGSADGTVAAVRSRFPEVILLQNPRSVGFAAGTNQALRQAHAPYWMLLGPDTVVRPGSLEVLLRELETHPEAWAVGPQLLNEDGSVQRSGRRFPTLLRYGLDGLLPRRLKHSRWWIRTMFGRADFTTPAEVDEIMGACILARREAFEHVGLLDERFFIYFEEVDWFLRVAAQGGKVRYQPQAKVYHHWGSAMTQMRGEGVLIFHVSALKFWRKHGGRPAELGIRLVFILQALCWMAGWVLLGLLRSRPWPRVGEQVRLDGRILALAAGRKRA